MNERVRDYINSSLSFAEEYELIFGKQLGTNKVFCPFHYNVNTPSAKLYGNVLKCFSCSRSYTVYDLLMKYNPDKIKEVSRSSILHVKDVSLRYHKTQLKVIPRDQLNLDQSVFGVICEILTKIK